MKRVAGRCRLSLLSLAAGSRGFFQPLPPPAFSVPAPAVCRTIRRCIPAQALHVGHGSTHGRHMSTSTSSGCVDSRPGDLKTKFTLDEYNSLVNEWPTWEEDLAGLDKNTIDSKLVAIGFQPRKTPRMAGAIFVHLQTPALRLITAIRNGDTKHAITEMESIAKDSANVPDDAYVRPQHFPRTWAKEEWQLELLKGRAELDGLGKPPGEPSKGEKRVMGIWAGTGNGKSHRLMELKEFEPRKQLKAYDADGRNPPLTAAQSQRVDVPAVDRFVYVTYNMGQTLAFDRMHPELAFFLRTMLRDMGLTNKGCDNFLSESAEALKGISGNALQELCVEYFRMKKSEHVGIAFDEIRMLLLSRDDKTHPSIPVTTSRLGDLAAALEREGIACTAIVSSLTSQIFSSESGRPISEVFLPAIGPKSIHFIIEHGLSPEKQTPKNTAMVLAAAGSHFRSAVHAVEAVEANRRSIDPGVLLDVVRQSIETKLQDAEREYIREHILGMMENGQGVKDHRQRFVDRHGVVAPPFVVTAFRQQDGFEPNMHPAERIFEDSAFVDAPKQLERCGMYYDQLRALYEQPVVPHEIDVEKDDGSLFFKALRFDRKVTKNDPCPDSIFEVNDKIVRLVPGWSPPDNQYMLPSDGNHPLIDRACVAFGPGGAKCLVIYQDKINAHGFSDAVTALNEAATMLKQHLGYPVLCVAHVVQASAGTRAQDNFKHPYILVREAEIEAYYTPTFATPIRYVRSRHNLQTD